MSTKASQDHLQKGITSELHKIRYRSTKLTNLSTIMSLDH
uniref:Uncharacterized protein n=1 Tax=Arundo donax TaxID=35708 RepID=A0A0A9HP47_ARUDO